MRHRVRQHVNPLGVRYVHPRAQPVAWPAHVSLGAPLEVELGCAEGRFSFQLARARPDTCVVGLDIRDKVIAHNAERARAQGLTNLVFAYCNLVVDLDRVFAPGRVDRFHLLFPDPWFKTRQHKRRVIGQRLLEVIAMQLRPAGELHVASDVYAIALEAMAEIEERSDLGFANLIEPWSFWRGNPFVAQSRREDMTLRRGARVWRMRYGVGRSSSTVGR